MCVHQTACTVQRSFSKARQPKRYDGRVAEVTTVIRSRVVSSGTRRRHVHRNAMTAALQKWPQWSVHVCCPAADVEDMSIKVTRSRNCFFFNSAVLFRSACGHCVAQLGLGSTRPGLTRLWLHSNKSNSDNNSVGPNSRRLDSAIAGQT